MGKHPIVFTNKFKRKFKNLSQIDQQRVLDTITALSEDPFYPSLRCKKLKGKIKDFECRVNSDIRIIWRYKDGTFIVIVDVGHHDVLNKY